MLEEVPAFSLLLKPFNDGDVPFLDVSLIVGNGLLVASFAFRSGVNDPTPLVEEIPFFVALSNEEKDFLLGCLSVCDLKVLPFDAKV